MVLCLAIKCNRKWVGGMIHYWGVVFWSSHFAYWSPTSQEVSGHCLLIGSRAYISFAFGLLLHVILACFFFFIWLPLSWPMSFFILFSLSVLLRRGNARVAGCAFSIQTKSAHHTSHGTFGPRWLSVAFCHIPRWVTGNSLCSERQLTVL